MPDLIPSKRSKAAEAWLEREIEEQLRRYRRIEHEMNEVLAKQRDKWIDEFLERIQTRGYNVHFNMLRKIRPQDIPTKPKRRFRVVF